MTDPNSTFSLQVITYGATITSVKTADKNGVFKDIALGFDDMNGTPISMTSQKDFSLIDRKHLAFRISNFNQSIFRSHNRKGL